MTDLCRIRRAVMLLAMADVAPFCLPAQTSAAVTSTDESAFEEVNKRLPRWLRFEGEYRIRSEGFSGGFFKADNDDLYLLTRVRVKMQVQPLNSLKFVAQGQDSHVFGKNQHPAAPPFQDIIDLRMAYLDLGDLEAQRFGLRVGRQELGFGEQRLAGTAGWLNADRTFDAIRARYRGKAFQVDAFSAAVLQVRPGRFNKRQPGNNLHGLYGRFDTMARKATIEPYVFWRLTRKLHTESGAPGNLDSKTVGFRWVGQVSENTRYAVEMALQRGSLGTDSISAWAGHWMMAYTFARARPRLSLVAEYNYASGDRDPGDGKRETFDQLYPSNHNKYGLADQVGWQNMHHGRSAAEFRLSERWQVVGAYNSFWLARTNDYFYNCAGTPLAVLRSGRAEAHIGEELDIRSMWALNRRMRLEGGYAHLFPGAFLKAATPGIGYNYFYIYVEHNL